MASEDRYPGWDRSSSPASSCRSQLAAAQPHHNRGEAVGAHDAKPCDEVIVWAELKPAVWVASKHRLEPVDEWLQRVLEGQRCPQRHIDEGGACQHGSAAPHRRHGLAPQELAVAIPISRHSSCGDAYQRLARARNVAHRLRSRCKDGEPGRHVGSFSGEDGVYADEAPCRHARVTHRVQRWARQVVDVDANAIGSQAERQHESGRASCAGGSRRSCDLSAPGSLAWVLTGDRDSRDDEGEGRSTAHRVSGKPSRRRRAHDVDVPCRLRVRMITHLRTQDLAGHGRRFRASA